MAHPWVKWLLTALAAAVLFWPMVWLATSGFSPVPEFLRYAFILLAVGLEAVVPIALVVAFVVAWRHRRAAQTP